MDLFNSFVVYGVLCVLFILCPLHCLQFVHFIGGFFSGPEGTRGGRGAMRKDRNKMTFSRKV